LKLTKAENLDLKTDKLKLIGRLRQDAKLALIATESEAEAFDLAVEGGDFYSKELGGASLIASRPLQRLTD
jgi:hypothetical protein